MIEFKPFPKIPRFFREVVITELLDGVDSAIIIDKEGGVGAQNKSRVLTTDNDSFGFAKWVESKANDLRRLGEGHYFGTWWGRGIQRGYGIEDRRFSLFSFTKEVELPECVGMAPVILKDDYSPWTIHDIRDAAEKLRENGSYASPGFMQPEGIVVFHTASRKEYKVLLENDDAPKGIVHRGVVDWVDAAPPPRPQVSVFVDLEGTEWRSNWSGTRPPIQWDVSTDGFVWFNDQWHQINRWRPT